MNRLDFISGPESVATYKRWKEDWRPPNQSVRAIGDRLVVEFSPAVSSSSLVVPEGASYTAIVIHDGIGEIPQGSEVIMLALNGTNFTHEGRILTIVESKDILGIAQD